MLESAEDGTILWKVQFELITKLQLDIKKWATYFDQLVGLDPMIPHGKWEEINSI
jgi:hypothetical protein